MGAIDRVAAAPRARRRRPQTYLPRRSVPPSITSSHHHKSPPDASHRLSPIPPIRACTRTYNPALTRDRGHRTHWLLHFPTGYKLGEKKTAEELAALDAEDESLAKWKASLGIGAGGTAHAPPVGPQVRLHPERSRHRIAWALRCSWMAVMRVLTQHSMSRSRCCPCSSNQPL